MDLREVREFLKDSLIYILIGIGVLIVFVFVFSFQKVVGDSMYPKYQNDDIVFLSKIGPKIFQTKRNDIIAFNSDSGSVYIKRVIAGPGDNVYAKDGIVYVNDIAISEEYLSDVTTDDFKFENVCIIEGCEEGVIPEGYFFVLGDNREVSIDSRFNIIGLINKKDIMGKVLFRILPRF